VSSAPVGSSANSTSGSVTIARATATRWACPPDISDGRTPASSATSNRSSQSRATASAGRRRLPSSSNGSATFSAAVSSGTSWPNWNSTPKRVRRSRDRPASDSALITRSPDPSRSTSRTSPASGRSTPARHSSSVDLPEPDGPLTARISPRSTCRLMPRKAGLSP